MVIQYAGEALHTDSICGVGLMYLLNMWKRVYMLIQYVGDGLHIN